jgi:hypothetical protein
VTGPIVLIGYEILEVRMSCASRRVRRRKRKEGWRQCTQNFTGTESGQVAGLVSDVEILVLLPEIVESTR